MKLYDPLRPKVGERLCLVGPDGKRACAIPNLKVDLQHPEGHLDVEVHTGCAPNLARYFRFKGTTFQELAKFQQEFMVSPEEALAEWFNWSYETNPGKAKTAAAAAKLEDYGLDLGDLDLDGIL